MDRLIHLSTRGDLDNHISTVRKKGKVTVNLNLKWKQLEVARIGRLTITTGTLAARSTEHLSASALIAFSKTIVVCRMPERGRCYIFVAPSIRCFFLPQH